MCAPSFSIVFHIFIFSYFIAFNYNGSSKQRATDFGSVCFALSLCCLLQTKDLGNERARGHLSPKLHGNSIIDFTDI